MWYPFGNYYLYSWIWHCVNTPIYKFHFETTVFNYGGLHGSDKESETTCGRLFKLTTQIIHPDSTVHWANTGPTWGAKTTQVGPCWPWPHEPCYLGKASHLWSIVRRTDGLSHKGSPAMWTYFPWNRTRMCFRHSCQKPCHSSVMIYYIQDGWQISSKITSHAYDFREWVLWLLLISARCTGTMPSQMCNCGPAVDLFIVALGPE